MCTVQSLSPLIITLISSMIIIQCFLKYIRSNDNKYNITTYILHYFQIWTRERREEPSLTFLKGKPVYYYYYYYYFNFKILLDFYFNFCSLKVTWCVPGLRHLIRKKYVTSDWYVIFISCSIQPKRSLIGKTLNQDTQTAQHLHLSPRLQEKLTDLPQSRTNPNTDRPAPIRADQTDQLQSRTTLVSTSTTNCSHPAQSMSTALSLLTSTDRVIHFSKQQLEAWTQQYSPWLYLNGNNVGCTFCKYAKRLF